MTSRRLLLCLSILVLVTSPRPGIAQLKAGASTSSSASSTTTSALGRTSTSNRASVSAAVGGGFMTWPPYYVVGTPNGPYAFMLPVVVWGVPNPPVMMSPTPYPMPVPVAIERGPIAPPPPANLVPPPVPEQVQQPRRRGDPARAAQLVTVGDRLFRNDNLKKAEERYLQAARVDPQSASPLVRLAQVALSRRQYAAACQWLRDAETVQPGWILTAPDIQALYGEPADFADCLAHLETHLQVHPRDRDAWLLLGAELFLSGRTARAGDVFLRLKDPGRKPDIALAAFLEASRRE